MFCLKFQRQTLPFLFCCYVFSCVEVYDKDKEKYKFTLNMILLLLGDEIFTWRSDHLLPFLKESCFKTVSWIEGISFMSRHQFLHWLKNDTQLKYSNHQKKF